MVEENKKKSEIFVAIYIGGTWRVMDTRTGEQVAAGPLNEYQAVDLALLLTNMARDYKPEGRRLH